MRVREMAFALLGSLSRWTSTGTTSPMDYGLDLERHIKDLTTPKDQITADSYTHAFI